MSLSNKWSVYWKLFGKFGSVIRWLSFPPPYRRTVIVGAGYIAVEMAGILSTLGSKTSLVIRQTGVRNHRTNRNTAPVLSRVQLCANLVFPLQVLRNFDSLISSNCTKELQNSGIDLWKNSQLKSVSKTDRGLEVTITTKDPEKKNDEEKISTIQEVDCLLWAIGRQPNTSGLNISETVTSANVPRQTKWLAWCSVQ